MALMCEVERRLGLDLSRNTLHPTWDATLLLDHVHVLCLFDQRSLRVDEVRAFPDSLVVFPSVKTSSSI
jgi:hypothetical protein